MYSSSDEEAYVILSLASPTTTIAICHIDFDDMTFNCAQIMANPFVTSPTVTQGSIWTTPVTGFYAGYFIPSSIQSPWTTFSSTYEIGFIMSTLNT